MKDKQFKIERLVYYIAILLFAAIAVNFNTLFHGFLWDDKFVFLNNPLMDKSPLSFFSAIDNGRVTDVTPYYRPFTLLSFWIEKNIHGFNPYYVRGANLLLQMINVALIFQFLKLFSVSSFAAFLSTLFFAVHPINSEVVNFNAGGRNTMLASAFMLISFILYKRFDKSKPSFIHILSAMALFAGMLCKETAFMLLFLLIYIEKDSIFNSSEIEKKSALLRLLPSLSSSLFYVVLRIRALNAAGSDVSIIDGLFERLLNNIYIIPKYLLHLLRVDLLSPVYYLPDDMNLYILQIIAGWGAIAAISYWIYKYNFSSQVKVGFVATFLFWFPVSGVFPIPSAVMADRYVYIPFIGALVVLSSLVQKYIVDATNFRTQRIATFFLMIFLFAGYTVYHNRIWQNEVTLFSWLIKQYPNNAMPYHNLACAYLEENKDFAKASQLFEAAYSINPYFPKLRTQMGYVSFMQGNLSKAEEHYIAALAQDPYDSEALLKYGELLELKGYPKEALSYYRRFVDLKFNELHLAVGEINNRIRRIEMSLYTQWAQ